MKKKIRLTESELTRLVKRIIKESEVDDLDNWIESNIDYISPSSLGEAVKELFNLRGEVTVDKMVEKDRGGDEYGENWNKILIIVRHDGEVLLKVWVKSDFRYDYGKNVTEFDNRFYFNEYAL